MARIRTIKPDFWTDEKVVELDFAARLFFIGMWNHADDNGNVRRSAKRLKMQIFPADVIDCEPLIKSLIDHGMLMEYSVNDVDYLHIRCFTKHQVINRKSKSAIPLPPWLSGLEEPAPQDETGGDDPPPDGAESRNKPPNQTDNSRNTRGSLNEESLTEKEVEWEGSKPKGSNDDVRALIRGSPVDNPATLPFLPADEIAALLTRWECERGKSPRFDPANETLRGWRVNAVQLRAAYDAALKQRTSTPKDRDSPVNAGFLNAFVTAVLAPPRVAVKSLRAMTDVELEAEGRRLGVSTHGLARDQCVAKLDAARSAPGGHAA